MVKVKNIYLNREIKMTFCGENQKKSEIITKVDSKNENLNFANVGEEMAKSINGNTIKLPNSQKAKELLHMARVSWLKSYLPEI